MPSEKKIITHEGLDPYVYIRAKAFLETVAEVEGRYHQDHVAAMNRAFACELFLKCLWVRQTFEFELEDRGGSECQQVGFPKRTYESIRGHDLLKIFEELPEGRKDWLVRRFYEDSGENLKSDLEVCRDLFVDLRYFHEGDAISYPADVLTRLSTFLCAAVEAAMIEDATPTVSN